MSQSVVAQVTIILVTYNSRKVVGKALASIPSGIPTIVVDNASSDGTADYIRAQFPAVLIIQGEKNIGFGPANNVALEQIETPFALLMNPDSYFNDANAIDGLLAAADRYSEAAILAPTVYLEDGSAQTTLFAPLIMRRKINKAFPFTVDDIAGDVCAFSLSGAVMLLRMSAFEGEPHFFDPNIFMYFEDDDICISLNRRGFTTMLIPQVSVTHLFGQSSPQTEDLNIFKLYHMSYSQLYILSKYGNKLGIKLKALRMLLLNGLRTVLWTGLLQRKRVLKEWTRLRAAWKFLANRH